MTLSGGVFSVFRGRLPPVLCGPLKFTTQTEGVQAAQVVGEAHQSPFEPRFLNAS